MVQTRPMVWSCPGVVVFMARRGDEGRGMMLRTFLIVMRLSFTHIMHYWTGIGVIGWFGIWFRSKLALIWLFCEIKWGYRANIARKSRWLNWHLQHPGFGGPRFERCSGQISSKLIHFVFGKTPWARVWFPIKSCPPMFIHRNRNVL